MIEMLMMMPDLPEGWEYTGEYRPAHNEKWVDWNNPVLGGSFVAADKTTNFPVPIIRRSALAGKKLVQTWPIGTIYKDKNEDTFCVVDKGVFFVRGHKLIPYASNFFEWSETNENTEILYTPGKE